MPPAAAAQRDVRPTSDLVGWGQYSASGCAAQGTDGSLWACQSDGRLPGSVQQRGAGAVAQGETTGARVWIGQRVPGAARDRRGHAQPRDAGTGTGSSGDVWW